MVIKTIKNKCGLCNKGKKLTKTECCDNWICDDEGDYVMFSFSRNSCSRNHNRFTLCGFHNQEQHEGAWLDCSACKTSFDTEMFVYYGTNEYNFELLKNPAKFTPTLCKKCSKVIKLGSDGYMISRDGYFCFNCAN